MSCSAGLRALAEEGFYSCALPQQSAHHAAQAVIPASARQCCTHGAARHRVPRCCRHGENGMLPCPALPCPALPCPALLCCAVLCCAVLCCAVLCSNEYRLIIIYRSTASAPCETHASWPDWSPAQICQSGSLSPSMTAVCISMQLYQTAIV